MIPQAHSSILKISPYVGGDITPQGMIRRVALASNESSFGPSPRARAVIEQSADQVHLYPSGNASALKEAIAVHHNLKKDQIVTGTGSEELLHLVAKAYAGPGSEIIYPQYGFMVYPIATLCVGATPVIVPQPHFKSDVDEILKRITEKTKLIFLDTPANPLGSKVSASELHRLVENVPSHVVLVIDAAYADYVEHEDYTSGLEWVEERPNLMVTRTFSKIYGLAGLRVGWAYTSPEICDVINRIRAPFNVNSLGQKAAIEALGDLGWVQQTREYTIHWRTWLEEQLTKLGLSYVPGAGNFTLIDFTKAPRSAADIYQELGKRGIIVRPTTPYKLPNHLRVTIGKSDEVVEFVDQLTRILAGQ